jgi:DNA recombination protein RmuC
LQLRRCIEIAGMTEHVDFELQETLRTDDGRLRPDARFLLPEGRSFVADSKVPLDAFLDAQEAEDESTRQVHLARHARQAREHVRSLSTKDYQGQFKAGEMPDLVVCFIPNEPALHAAFTACCGRWSSAGAKSRWSRKRARSPRPQRRCTAASRNSSATSRKSAKA